ncbi:MAG: hypothetical protein ACR2GH_11450 [Pseudonocardia sp.]
MWAQLARSERSDRIFETVWDAARRVGRAMAGAGRSGLLGLLTAADVAEVLAMLAREDDYRIAGQRVRDLGPGRTGRQRS